jgi:hypothetical protein
MSPLNEAYNLLGVDFCKYIAPTALGVAESSWPKALLFDK